jgi:hypothetical protein
MLNSDKLQNLFDNDPLGLLEVKPNTEGRNEDKVLVEKFNEIVDFYNQNQRLPEENNGVNEHTLYSRLCDFRDTDAKRKMLEKHDVFGLLVQEEKKVFTIEDILDDDPLGLLDDDDMGLFDFNLVQRPDERVSADFVARRKYIENFEKYEQLFKGCHYDLKQGERKLTKFHENQIQEGAFFTLNGLLVYVDKLIDITVDKFGKRDGRTKLIFENGTESNMLFRSLGKGLFQNGQGVTFTNDEMNKQFENNYNAINDEDKESGYIYILKSKSEKSEIKEIKHLYKIGFATTTVEDRIKNAAQEPTFLMAEVRIIMTYTCYNMNPHKLELLLHNFFGSSCLNVDVFDALGNRHTPREWFIAPLYIIEQAVHLIISGEIVKYRYDGEKEEIVVR